MLYIPPALAAEGHAACYVTAEPAAHNAYAHLISSRTVTRPRLTLLRTVWAFYQLRCAFLVYARHPFIPLQLLCS